MKHFLFMCLIFFSFSASATVYQVGSSRPHESPNALYLAAVLQDNDTIEIDAETYIGQASLAVWLNNNLVIKGVGGQPQLIAAGEYIWGKGIWVAAGNNITIENISFSGASVPDQNGAGIRLDGIGLTVRHCHFLDNENGILTANSFEGDILIEYSEFDNNGFGDGFSHNVYIGHINKLTFRYNYSHHAFVGHNLKSRANENIILYNRIMDEDTGSSSRLVDLSNGGIALVMGNLLMQGENAINNNLLGFGLEGLDAELPHQIYVINNTFVNKREASCLFVSLAEGTNTANISNNIFAGSTDVVFGNTTEMENNLVDDDIANIGLISEGDYDYHLSPTSSAIDGGVTIESTINFSLTPDQQYEHPTSFSQRSVNGNIIDIGAYEQGEFVSLEEFTKSEVLAYPNPTMGFLNISSEAYQIDKAEIIDVNGRILLNHSQAHVLDLSKLAPGVYWLKLYTREGQVIFQSVFKE